MIQSLRIENYAIIDELEINLDKGLNIITGETGAGKSILLGALGLIMGQRADTKVLFDKSKKCIVEATFAIYPDYINKLLGSYDFDVEEELIIRREIVPAGKSRAFVNDTPAKLGFLNLLSQELIDLNQQFEITEIKRTDYQLEIIDALANHDTLIKKYKKTFDSYRDAQKQLNELQNMESTQLKEMDFMKFQLNELEEASLDADEQAALEAESELLSKADEIRLVLEESNFKLLENEQNIRDIVLALNNQWEKFGEAHPMITKGGEYFQSILDAISELEFTVNHILGDLDPDPVRLEEIQSRLDLIYTLQRKHNVQTVKELLGIQEELQNSLEAYINRGSQIESLENQINQLETDLADKSDKMSHNRRKVFPVLENKVNKKLALLAMNSAAIKVVCEQSASYRSDGRDLVSIHFKSNKGADFLPIKKVASGGESARLMLSIKSTVADVMQFPTMIFDEIDTGVSGEVAGKMGDILRKLSSNHQLICITHSPQVSSRANNHYLVYKQESKDRTFTHVRLLDSKERITEIAKMLSGDPPSTFALDNAKDLIEKQTI
ncbi:MAG: DNA repair protein RecN [Saprospiraceae bacterium]|nr:DNA repair protein RecN [Bacteroidia bacterium]NNF22700.1 DNA repair protein RecN [Saprospiraceae bacterium]